MAHPPVAALLPIAVLGLGFVVYCLVDLARQPRTRGLPRPVWALLVVISIPLGGIVYLLVGRPVATDRVAGHRELG